MTNNSDINETLSGRVILITGAAQGFGAALSLQAAKLGATIVLLDHQVKPMEKLYDQIVKQGYPEPAIYPFDFRGAKPEDYKTLVAAIVQTLGHLDDVIQNAASFRNLTPLLHHSVETWYEIMQVNINAPFLLTQACIEALENPQLSTMVYIDDRPEPENMAFWGAYGVSKFALEGLMRTVSSELENAANKQIVCYDPGPMPTKLLGRIMPTARIEDIPPMHVAVDEVLHILSAGKRNWHGQILKRGFTQRHDDDVKL